MPTINQLPTVTTVSGGDQFPLYVASQGDARRCSVTTMIGYMEKNFDGVVANTVRTTPTTVNSLPTAASAGNGARAFVVDSSVTTFNSVVAAGGSNQVPVFSDGTNWKVG